MKVRNKNKQKTTTTPKGELSSSTERSRRCRESFCKRKDAHELHKAKDRTRQIARYVIKWNESRMMKNCQSKIERRTLEKPTLLSQVKTKTS